MNGYTYVPLLGFFVTVLLAFILYMYFWHFPKSERKKNMNDIKGEDYPLTKVDDKIDWDCEEIKKVI